MVHRNSDPQVDMQHHMLLQPHTIVQNHFAADSYSGNTASSNSFSNASPPVNQAAYLNNATMPGNRSDQRLPHQGSLLSGNHSSHSNTKSNLSRMSNMSGSILNQDITSENSPQGFVHHAKFSPNIQPTNPGHSLGANHGSSSVPHVIPMSEPHMVGTIQHGLDNNTQQYNQSIFAEPTKTPAGFRNKDDPYQVDNRTVSWGVE